MMKFFGTLQRDNKHWAIRCEPHVRTRFKRIFSQVKQHAGEVIQLTDTLVNCHELGWFIERFPLTLSPEDQEYLTAQSDAYLALQASVINVIDYQRPPMQFELAEPAHEFQKIAADLLINVKGLLLADDVGLGKTLSSICAMVIPENLPVLFVTLTHLPRQVEREVQRFAPQLKTHIIKKGQPYPLADKAGNAPEVIIISYSKLNGWADELAGKIRYVVFDEIQELRTGPGSQKYIAAEAISQQANLRLGLSATPIYNYGHEFYNVVNILRPDVLGSREEFLREWCVGERKIDNPQAFGSFLRDEGIMLLRKRADVQRELPPVQTIVQHIDSDTKVLDEVKGYAMELAKVILQSNQDFKGQKLRATEQFNILMRQATGIAKAPYVAEFVKMLVESGESVVLFGWHREVYSIWMERLAAYNPVLYTGTESPAAKDQAKANFIAGNSKVLIISLRSGAGLDGLQYHPSCSINVFGELDWSSGVHEQCIGRLYRDGQTKNVLSYFMLSETGSDPIISDVLGIKKQQLDGVKNKEGELITKLEGDSTAIKQLAAQYLKSHLVKEAGQC